MSSLETPKFLASALARPQGARNNEAEAQVDALKAALNDLSNVFHAIERAVTSETVLQQAAFQAFPYSVSAAAARTDVTADVTLVELAEQAQTLSATRSYRVGLKDNVDLIKGLATTANALSTMEYAIGSPSRIPPTPNATPEVAAHIAIDGMQRAFSTLIWALSDGVTEKDGLLDKAIAGNPELKEKIGDAAGLKGFIDMASGQIRTLAEGMKPKVRPRQ